MGGGKGRAGSTMMVSDFTVARRQSNTCCATWLAASTCEGLGAGGSQVGAAPSSCPAAWPVGLGLLAAASAEDPSSAGCCRPLLLPVLACGCALCSPGPCSLLMPARNQQRRCLGWTLWAALLLPCLQAMGEGCRGVLMSWTTRYIGTRKVFDNDDDDDVLYTFFSWYSSTTV